MSEVFFRATTPDGSWVVQVETPTSTGGFEQWYLGTLMLGHQKMASIQTRDQDTLMQWCTQAMQRAMKAYEEDQDESKRTAGLQES